MPHGLPCILQEAIWIITLSPSHEARIHHGFEGFHGAQRNIRLVDMLRPLKGFFRLWCGFQDEPTHMRYDLSLPILQRADGFIRRVCSHGSSSETLPLDSPLPLCCKVTLYTSRRSTEQMDRLKATRQIVSARRKNQQRSTLSRSHR